MRAVPNPIPRSAGFRKILPAVDITFFLATVFMCRVIPSARVAQCGSNLALALNLPALFVAATIGGVIRIKSSYSVLLSIPLLAILWYIVGLWLDRSLGFARRNPPKRSRSRDLTLVIVAGAAGLFLIPMVQTLFQEPNVREARAQVWVKAIYGWYGLLLIVIAEMIQFRFFKKHESAATSSNTEAH